MSEAQPNGMSSGRLHFVAIVIVTLIVMIFGVLVVVAPDRMGVPQMTPTPIATPIATPTP